MNYSVFYHHICCAAEEKGCSVDEMLTEAYASGIRYVELDRDAVGTEEKDILAFAQRLTHCGMQPSSIYGFYDWGKDDNLPGADDLLIRQAVLMGCGRIMVIPGFYSDVSDADNCRIEKARMIAGMQRMVELATSKGLTVTIECFDDARSPIATIAGMAEFLQEVPGLMVTLETGNFLFSGDDILQAQQLFRERVRHVHLKDRYLSSHADISQPERLVGSPVTAVTGEVLFPCAVGQGHIPMAEVIGNLAAWGYDGVMTIEHFGVASYADAIGASIEWLKEREKRL